MKMNSKTLFLGALLAALVIAAPLSAEARPYGRGGAGMGQGQGVGPNQQALTPEKQQALFAMRQAHFEKVRPIQEQLWAKQTTLDALSGNPKTDPKDITNLVSEISALRNQMYTENKAFADRMQKETGINMPCDGMGMGRGMGMKQGGYGHHGKGGMGRGNGGGYGRGCGRY